MPPVNGYEDVGLTWEDRGNGRVILRWRQPEEQEDGSRKRVQRTKMAIGPEQRRQLEDEIGKALRSSGFWVESVKPAAPLPVETNIEQAAADCVAWKVGTKGAAANTRAANAASMKRFFGTVRSVLGIDAEAAIPAAVMTLELFEKVTARLRADGFAASTLYKTIADVEGMWRWVADDPVRYPGVPRPPLNRSRILPDAPQWVAPDAVATWAETDACVRRVRLPAPRRAVIIARYTGLRLEQVAMIHKEDFRIGEATLLIRKGKSRREKALNRRIPVSRHLLDELGTWLTSHPDGPLFPQPDEPGVSMVNYRGMTRYVTEAWKAATADDEARVEVWAPPSLKKNRPDHAFRAAFQGALEDGGFSEAVIDELVGHAPKSTRGRHYKRPSAESLRRAVDSIPRIDWKEAAIDNVVHLPMRRRA